MFKYLKHFSLALLIALPAQAAVQTQRYFNNTGGLIDRYSPILVPSKNASDIQNIQFDTRGQLLKRGGYILNNTTNLLATSVTGGGYLQSTTGTSFMAVVVGTNIFTTGNSFGGSYTNVTGTVTLTSSANNLAQFTRYKDFGVICNDSDTPIMVQNNSAFALVKAATIAKTCESYNNYLLIGNTKEAGTVYGSRFRWSDLGDINTWPANNYIDVEPDDGDSIVAIKRYQSNVYIFKKRSIYEAVITGGAGAEAFIYRPIARNIGAWAKNSVRVVETKGIAFLGADGVYLFDGNNFNFISDQIQTKLNGMNRARYQYAVADVYQPKHQYWIAMSYGTETTNQTILVWDYIQEAWSVYKGITANALIAAEDSSGNQLLFSGDTAGKVYKQDSGTHDEPAGVNTGITSFYATPELTLNAPEVSKTFKYLYIFSKVTSTTTITVERGYDFPNSYQDSSTISVGQTGVAWGHAIWGTDKWPGTSVSVSRIELNRRARSIRIKFTDSSSTNLGVLGWVIGYTMEDFRGD